MNTANNTRVQSRSKILAALVVALVAISLPSSLPSYVLMLVSKALIYALFAVSLDLLLGYAGLVSLGHAAFFGVGGYTTAILIKKLQLKSFWIAGTAGVLAAVIVAVVFGLIALRARGLFFLLITFALGQMLQSAAIKWNAITGGYYGLAGILPPQLGVDIRWTSANLYVFVLIVTVPCIYLLYRMAQSPFGLALKAIRDQEDRVPSLGYDAWQYKYIAYVVSGLFAGIAGVLFVSFNGLIAPNHLGVNTSTLVMLMVLLGGAGTVFGPIVGAILIVFTEYYASVLLPERWPLILGSLFVVTVMFARGGVWGVATSWWGRVTARRWKRLESKA